MKTSTSDLRTLLHGSRSAAFSDLVTITLKDATVVRWTTAGWDLTYDSNTYTAGGTGTVPLIGRGTIREAVGLEVSTLELRLRCGTTAQIGGRSIQSAAKLGLLDDARVTVQRAYHSGPTTTVVGVVQRFSGVVSDFEVDSQEVRLRVQSDLYKLEELLPRHLIREKCSWGLFDAGCGLSKASFTSSETTTTGCTETTVRFVRGTAFFTSLVGGTVEFTSGALDGLTRTIRSYSYDVPSTTFTLVVLPLPSAPASSVGIDVVPGCDKTYATCSDALGFNNATRARMFPYVPPPDAVTR